MPNDAWGGVEPNLFGTDEFIAFCRAVGCEPMICVNAGNGTPAEAARWVEYCNGSSRTSMGARRAANGHPEPYRVHYWEIGNELWGRWQVHWTTASGYVDRYQQFAVALLEAGPDLQLYACGAPVFWGKTWNDTLWSGRSTQLTATTDHPLIGGNVSSTVDPLDVYRDFMAVPKVLEQKWAALRQDMLRTGIPQPRLAVTELQMFAHLDRIAGSNTLARLTSQNLVHPGTLAEGLYDVLIYHAAVRLAPFIDMVTHSAIVNHGGGLRKERERVYPLPCHYAQTAFSALVEATPVAIDLECPDEQAPLVLPELKRAASEVTYGVLDALAALGQDGSLFLSLVHRGSGGPIHLAVTLRDFSPSPQAEVRTLSAEVPWASNSLTRPDAVKPVDSKVDIRGSQFQIELPVYSVTRVIIRP